jgi:hypothetical protein
MKTRLFVALVASALLAVGCGDNGGDDGSDDDGTTDSAVAIDAPGSTIDAPGGTIDGPASDGASACSTCAMTSCSTELTTCRGSTPCSCTFDCVAGGGAEGSCKQTCNLPQNDMAWSSLIDCMDNMCANDC